MAYCRENGRVCPLPQRWNEVWRMLPDRQHSEGPGPPLILAVWHDTGALFKMLRLAEHIEWAEEYGVLEEIAKFLRGLPEDQWFHLGDAT